MNESSSHEEQSKQDPATFDVLNIAKGKTNVSREESHLEFDDDDSLGEPLGENGNGEDWQLGAAFRALALGDSSHLSLVGDDPSFFNNIDLAKVFTQAEGARIDLHPNEEEDCANEQSKPLGRLSTQRVKDDEDEERVVDTGSWSDSQLLVHDVLVYTSTDGNKYVNQYKKLDFIGEGSNCKVKLYENVNTGGLFALKAFRKSELHKIKRYFKTDQGRMSVVTYLEQVQREVNVLLSLKPHDHVCRLIQVLDGQDIHKLYLVFPFYPGGRLMSHDAQTSEFWSPRFNGVLPLSFAALYCHQIASALLHLHSQGVAHRDVKPENILLDGAGSNAILADFSSAVLLEGESKETGIVHGTDGSYAFFSPEICAGGPYNAYAGDVWALGVSMYVMVFGVLPFHAEGPKQLFDMIADTKVPVSFPSLESVCRHRHLEASATRVESALASQQLAAFIQHVLAKKPEDRLRSADALMNHPFLLEEMGKAP